MQVARSSVGATDGPPPKRSSISRSPGCGTQPPSCTHTRFGARLRLISTPPTAEWRSTGTRCSRDCGASRRTSIGSGSRSSTTIRTCRGSRDRWRKRSGDSATRMRSCFGASGCTRGARHSPRRSGTSRFSNFCSKQSAVRGRRAMGIVRIPEEDRTLRDAVAISEFLAAYGIEYERWTPASQVPAEAPPQTLLDAYASKIDDLKGRGGYVTADVIDVTPDTPGLDAMLAKFNTEHWHDEDEVRLIVEGRGLFHIHPPDGPVFAIEVQAGDLIRVPKGTHHWFDLCGDRRIRAVRLFQNPSGWTPRYTNSGLDRGFQPVCFGPSYLPP